jgi:hypothetical protein
MTNIYLKKPIEKIDIVKLSYLTGREHCYYFTTSLDEPTIDKKKRKMIKKNESSSR